MPAKSGPRHTATAIVAKRHRAPSNNLFMDRYQFGLGSSLKTSCRANPQRERIILKYSLSMSMLMCVASLNSSRLMMDRSKGGPTDRLERMVESIDTNAHLAACARLLQRVMTRSMMGLPYLDSPI